MQDAGLVYDGSASRSRPSSYTGVSDDRHFTYSDPAPAVPAVPAVPAAGPSAGRPPAASAPQIPGDVPAPDAVLTSGPGDPALVTASTHRGFLPSGDRDLAPAFVKVGDESLSNLKWNIKLTNF